MEMNSAQINEASSIEVAVPSGETSATVAVEDTGLAINTAGLNLWYGNFQALYDINLGNQKRPCHVFDRAFGLR